MRRHGLATLVAILAVIAPSTIHAQGSWLPFGTIGASHVAVNPAGVVWLVGREPHSIRTTLVLGETSFALPATRGNPARVAVDLHGFPWLVESDGTVWHWVRNAGAENWVKQPIAATDIAVGANGEVWAIGTDQHVLHLHGDAWEPVSGTGVKIAVDPSGNPWVINAAGQISKYDGSSWTALPGKASEITVAPDGTVFVLGPTRVRGGFEILRLNGSTWERIVGGGATAIAAGARAVYVAQDTTTNMVLTSTNLALRTDSAPGDATAVGSSPVASSAVAASTAATVASSLPKDSASPSRSGSGSAAGSTTTAGAAGTATGSTAAAPQSGSSAVGSAAGKVGGLLSGLLSAGASAAAPIAGAAAEGAAAGAVKGAIPTTVGIPVPTSMPGAGGLVAAGSSAAASAAPSGAASQANSAASTSASTSKPKLDLKNVAMRPMPSPPVSGNLLCPVVGAGARLVKGCALVKQAAQMLWPAPSTDCAAPSFADPRNGGECWTCPASFVRSDSPVDAKNACWKPVTDNLTQKVDTQYSVATQTKGCSLLTSLVGFGTAFRNGNECWGCPLGLVRSVSSLNAKAIGNFAECVAEKNADRIVYQLAQYPESGVYRFMPGLLQMALADPKTVDAFLLKRANGDLELKKKLWADMIADPAASAELKALLFASLLTVAEKTDSTAVGADAVREFETYVHDRRSYVANEAARIYDKWQQVHALAQVVKNSGGARKTAADAISAAATNYKALAWSGAMPDSAGAAFIVASTALSHLGLTNSVDSSVTNHVASFDLAYLTPVTKALENGFGVLQSKDSEMVAGASALSRLADSVAVLKRAESAMISTTLLTRAAGLNNEVTALVDKGKAAAEYSSYVAEMGKTVSVKQMLESHNPQDLQSLMLYWALATSPHKASDVVGAGALTGAQLCSSNAWTTEQCATAKEMVAAAAKAAGVL